MRNMFYFSLAALLGLSLTSKNVNAIAILAPGDAMVGIDTDGLVGGSNYPAGEAPSFALDSNSGTKYLNFSGQGSGFIVTPAASSTLKSLQLTTGGDAPDRDPASFKLWGTNDAIVSTDDSTGLGGEAWTLIDGFDFTGGLELPAARNTIGPLVDISANTNSYSSYKILFPTLKAGGQLFQIADVELYSDVAGTMAVQDVLDPVIAIRHGADSDFPDGEAPSKIIDGDDNSKYLNFGRANTGFIVTPASGSQVVKTFQITTANDHDGRDPSSWELYGTDDTILSGKNSVGLGESWSLVDSGSLSLPSARNAAGDYVLVDNDTAFTSYKMIFTTLKDGGENSMQISEVQFYSTNVPEPASLVITFLVSIGMAVGFMRKKRNK